jgi:hypothetical protein
MNRSSGKPPATQGESLKNKLRSLQRLLNREKNPGLPRPAVHGKVRLLRKLEAAAKVHNIESKEKRYSELYHHVKFFERRKAERRLKKAQKKLEDLRKGGEGDMESKSANIDKEEVKLLLQQCEEEVKECEDNVLYVKWFPKHIKYVALYPSRSTSKDEQLEIRRAALRRWTLINAEAKMFVPTPPEQDGHVDFGENDNDDDDDDDDDDNDEIEGKREEEEEKEKEEVKVQGNKIDKTNKTLLKEKVDDNEEEDKEEDNEEEAPSKVDVKKQIGKKRKRNEANVKLPSRPVAPLQHSKGSSSRHKAESEMVDFEDDAAVAAESKGGSGIAPDDAFFSAVPEEEDNAAFHAPPVFVELAPEDDPSFADSYGNADDGNWRSAPSFNGQRTSAARFERERLGADSKRYRDSAASSSSSARQPSTFSKSLSSSKDGGRETSTTLIDDSSKLQGLLGRKRKRAERALRFEQSRGGGGEAVLGVGGLNKAAAKSYDEAFFGTSRDQGARLKYQERIKASDRKLVGTSTKNTAAATVRTGRDSFNKNDNSNSIKGGGGGGARGSSDPVLPIHHAVPKRLVASIANAGKSTRMTFD